MFELIKKWAEHSDEKRVIYFREAFLVMGVPEKLVPEKLCVDMVEELKEYIHKNSLHFQHVYAADDKEYIVCVVNNNVKYLKEIVF